MIDIFTKNELLIAIDKPKNYKSGKNKKELQVIYDKMLNELSEYFFNEPCLSRMSFRKKINSLDLTTNFNSNELDTIKYIKGMLKNDHLLFNRDYRDSNTDVEKFLTNHLQHFIGALTGV